MSWLYHQLVRPVLFTHDPEEIHNLTMRGLNWVSRNAVLCEAMHSFLEAPPLPVRVMGLDFPNPVGLAAGMDKTAEALPAWNSMGFGFAELGAVTWHAQPGNPKPRVFRAVTDLAIVNRMGFNNPGAEAVAHTLSEWKALGLWPKHPVGINLGKSKITPLDKAPDDYANSLRTLWPLLDFFVVNVSSPNTPNLRELQDKRALDEIFCALQEVAASFAGHSDKRLSKPLLVKVAPDLTLEALDQIIEIVESRGIAGIVATNTTIARPENAGVDAAAVYREAGGLSGAPLRKRSLEVVAHLHRQTRGRVPIIGVGGIFSAADAWALITAGASLVQVYTGLVYEGPTIVRNIVSGLIELLQERGLRDLSEATGMGKTQR